MSLEWIVEVCSTNPAKLVNLYPRKGAIVPGADADLVVLDMQRRETITAARSYYKCGWTSLEGREVQGVPVMTILRGQVIAENGRYSRNRVLGGSSFPWAPRPRHVRPGPSRDHLHGRGTSFYPPECPRP